MTEPVCYLLFQHRDRLMPDKRLITLKSHTSTRLWHWPIFCHYNSSVSQMLHFTMLYLLPTGINIQEVKFLNVNLVFLFVPLLWQHCDIILVKSVFLNNIIHTIKMCVFVSLGLCSHDSFFFMCSMKPSNSSAGGAGFLFSLDQSQQSDTFTFTSFKLYIQIYQGHPAADKITTDFSSCVRLIDKRVLT